jgi:hypothetical protein
LFELNEAFAAQTLFWGRELSLPDEKLHVNGGADKTGFLGETWIFDAAGWHALSIAGPSPRHGFGMATYASRVILFGGVDQQGFCDDTWHFDGSAWTQLPISGPDARFLPAVTAYQDNLLLYGGHDVHDAIDDTWRFDGKDWTKLDVAGPDSAEGFLLGSGAVTFNSAAILFGGDRASFFDQTWRFDGASWKELSSVLRPAPRTSPAMATLGGASTSGVQ